MPSLLFHFHAGMATGRTLCTSDIRVQSQVIARVKIGENYYLLDATLL
jgi:hypothetical protein